MSGTDVKLSNLYDLSNWLAPRWSQRVAMRNAEGASTKNTSSARFFCLSTALNLHGFNETVARQIRVEAYNRHGYLTLIEFNDKAASFDEIAAVLYTVHRREHRTTYTLTTNLHGSKLRVTYSVFRSDMTIDSITTLAGFNVPLSVGRRSPALNEICQNHLLSLSIGALL